MPKRRRRLRKAKPTIEKEIQVFSCDPGTRNYAAAMTRGRLMSDGSIKIKIIGTRILQSTFRDLKTSVSFSLKNFIGEIDSIVQKYGEPNEIIMERFQSRGMGGTTIECVNFMIGGIVYHFQDEADVKLVTAAQWKNRANARVDYKNTPKAYDLHRVITDKTEHELDAVMMGIYYIHQLFGAEDYQCFADPANFDKFMEYFLTSPSLDI